MIALIVCGIICIIFFILIMLDEEDTAWKSIIYIVIFSISFITLFISLMTGISIYKWENKNKLLYEKKGIELTLNENLNYDILKDAEKHNKEIQKGNNYWCRLNIEDRSEFLINIDEYLEKDDAI